MTSDHVRAERSAIAGRLHRLVRDRLAPAVVAEAHPLRVAAWTAPGEPVPFAVAAAARYEPSATGMPWGAPWSTTWLRVEGEVPASWAAHVDRVDLVVDLGFGEHSPGFQAEGLAFGLDGRVLKGVSPLNRHLPLRLLLDGIPGDALDAWRAGAAPLPVAFLVEAAGNPRFDPDFTFAPTPLGDPGTLPTEPQYRLGPVEAVLRDQEVWALLHDIAVLREIADEPGTAQPRRTAILYALQDMLDAVDPAAPRQTAAQGRAALREQLARPAAASAHRVVAGGHAHIDSGWLWPYRETRRKVARTYSNALALMDEYPDFVFVTSSAQHLAWLKEGHPDLFERVTQRAREGRFVPVGGMWVEADANLPGGESMVRQFLAGQSFFQREFGRVCEEVWLPDSFGYSAALPQLMRGAGARWFLTQKLSWNDTNRMPHHTFWWEGIDGSRILAHFPPVDNYNCDLTARQLALAERQQAERDRDTVSYAPSGWGDGGGGPTRDHAERELRQRDLEGLPRVRWGSPAEFFGELEAELRETPVWSGELYLELHRGVSTSQAAAKRGNRRCERLLREAELWCATASVRTGAAYPHAVLRECWETVLLHQFHDSLPGSAIAWVYQVMAEDHDRIARTAEKLIQTALAALGDGERVVLNSGPLPVAGVPALGAAPAAEPAAPCSVRPRAGGGFVLDDGRATAELDADGMLVSLRAAHDGRELIHAADPGNRPALHRDLPNRWDAWDVDHHHRRVVQPPTGPAVLRAEDGGVVVERALTERSRLVQRLRLADGALRIETDVDWHERETLLKLVFPFAFRAAETVAETHFGHVRRPATANTSWEHAKFEASVQRWLHLAEGDLGVAVANEASPGYDVQLTHGEHGTGTRLGVSLLRGSQYPDPEADQGRHTFVLTVRPSASVAQAICDGYALALPLREARLGSIPDPLVASETEGVLVEAVKLAEDGSGDLIVRVYESRGRQVGATVETGFAAATARRVDLLERDTDEPLETEPANHRLRCSFPLRAFQVATLRIAPGTGSATPPFPARPARDAEPRMDG